MGPRSHERGNGGYVNALSTSQSCFNGAAFSRTRKRGLCLGGLCLGGLASMGPRSHERGNYNTIRAVRTDSTALQWGRVLTNAETTIPLELFARIRLRFNGAAFSRTRKPFHCSSAGRLSLRFNGAAFSRTRKRLSSCRSPGATLLRFNGAAFSRTRKPALEHDVEQAVAEASMGPRSHERGNSFLTWTS